MNTQRCISMASGHNFRDLGGYATRDGRQTRWNVLFRSGSMAQLNDADHATLLELDIQVICDLRSSEERKHQPSKLPTSAQPEIWSRDYDESGADLVKLLASAETTAASARKLMVELYRNLAYEQAPAYRVLFDRIAKGPLPLLFHCAAGKDRTGVAAALILEALDVPRETIICDYLATNDFFDRGRTLLRTGSLVSPAIRDDVWNQVMRAEPEYITAMFDTLEARHGSVAGFLSDVLGFEVSSLAAFKDRLLL